MKLIEPELQRLEASVENAGRHKATWWSTWLALSEPLSKVCGHGGTNEQLRRDVHYAAARLALYRAWSRGTKAQPISPPAPIEQQAEFFDTSVMYD